MGFEPELIRIIADNIFSNIVKHKGTIQFLNRDWSKILDETSLGKCDLAISSISITDEREKKYHLRFSQPYYNTTLSLIANTKKFQPSSRNGENLLETLKGKRVGVLSKSTSLKTLEIFNNILQDKYPNSYTNLLIQIATFPRVEKALYDLVALTPKLDFVLNDKVYTDSFLFKDNTLDITMVYELKPNLYPSDFPKEYIGEEYGIALNYTESDILEEIDRTIANLKANGQLNNMIAEHEETYKRLAREKLEAVQNRET
ncbi:MAG: substrate-binding periplasmic protein [Xenococcaceae cyanobacterium]